MSFDSAEQSIALAKPGRLYLFERGASLRWAYASTDRDITEGLITYLHTPISDDGIRQSGKTSVDDLIITAPAALEVAQLFRGVPPSDEIYLTIRDRHEGEADTVVSWSGTIATVRWPSVDRCSIRCQSLAASFEQEGLRLGFQRSCNRALGDRWCKVDMEPLAVPGTVITLDGATISATAWAGYVDGWFDGGYVQWPVGGGEFDKRGIASHVGGVLTLLGGTDGIALNNDLTAYPGCDHTIQVCQDKFANSPNHGGVKDLPGKSPFDGDPVF